MAMKNASSWWSSVLFTAGLLSLFLGQRPFAHIDSVRLVTIGAGALLVLGITALRAWIFLSTTGDRRKVASAVLLCNAGVLLSLALYVATTDWGRGVLGLGNLQAEALTRYTVPMTVLWATLLLVSLVPMLMIDISLGSAMQLPTRRSSGIDDDAVEAFRVREMGASGLTIALAAAFLMVTCNIAEQRNVRRDVSYFKTSSPGEATHSIARSTGKPIRVLLFFPEVNTVKNEVRGYFEVLKAAGANVEIEEHDRMISADLAREYRVRDEGTVVVVHDGKSDSFRLTVDPARSRSLAARTELRELDGKVNESLLKVMRARRKAYLTVGHGEINDADATWGLGNGAQATLVKATLRGLNYEVEDLGLMQGLGSEVPSDASMVLMLAPREPLSEEVQASLDRYLARGGKMLIALDPLGTADLGVLEQRLGVRFSATPVTDDESFIPRTRTIADRRIILSNRFSSHASMTSLGSGGPRQGILFINAGSIERADLAEGMPAPTRTYVIRSMNEAFADENDNFQFDEGLEQRRQYNLTAAIELDLETPEKGKVEAEAAEHAEGEHAEGEHAEAEAPAEDTKAEAPADDAKAMRVMLFADADIFIDQHHGQFRVLNVMLQDAIKWLGGEEHISGEIVSEQDVLIEHTRSEDVLLFYGTIVGAPLLVLGFGLGLAWWRRQRTQRRAS